MQWRLAADKMMRGKTRAAVIATESEASCGRIPAVASTLAVGLGLMLALAMSGTSATAFGAPPKLEALFQLPLPPAGLTIIPGGQYVLSVSFEGKPQNRVVQINPSGASSPFPTPTIGQASAGESLLLDAVEGMQTDPKGIVWMVDNGRRSELPPKIVAWDTDHQKLHRVINLAPPAVLRTSLLDDLAVDSENGFIYIADPASGEDAALIVVELATGLARRVLQGHPSVIPQAGLDLVIDGQSLRTIRLDGSVADPDGGVNPIALDKKAEWLYFGPLRSPQLFRVKTEDLRNLKHTPDLLAGMVEVYSGKPICDSITLDNKGNIYVADLSGKAIGMINASARQYQALVTDPRLLWPDGLCFGEDGKLYFFNNARKCQPPSRSPLTGTSPVRTAANYLFRIETPASGRAGE